jgi:membrane protease YdiL (CAAX protease family)
LKNIDRGIDKPMLLFWVLAYALAWSVLGIFKLLGDQVGIGGLDLLNMAENMNFGNIIPSLPKWLLYLLSRIADFSFSIAGLVMIYFTEGKEGLRALWQRIIKWKFHWGWYLAAFLPLAFYFLATLVANNNAPTIFGEAVFNGSTLRTLLFSIQGGLLVSLFLRGAMGEELGLRGFALPRLQMTMSPFRASLVIGALWAAWHIPVLLGRDVVSIWEEGFETIFPNLVNSDWELVSTLLTLFVGIVAGVLVWRQGK